MSYWIFGIEIELDNKNLGQKKIYDTDDVLLFSTSSYWFQNFLRLSAGVHTPFLP
ncbi:hypothetical protein DNHGIG_09160 [Collibacillus ludicampi]|uniref:Uncharacterized protein n=1 Tax=Collibacillus ludicampi TaxID=2771369 RepID=A0AAV4LBZ4_9BACL|nr:hypothetical protein [Collibacillus ludicampi]GIM45367.1 hypothetical protein DNHGIG_09160 [Collibacillus ludicampi]